MLLIPHIVSPNGKCPLNIFLAVFHFHLPDRLQGLVFGTIDGFRIHPLEPPCVEKLLQELSPSELGTEVTLLYLDLQRLERPLMPLFNSNLESVLPKPLHSSNKLTQCGMAFLIESAIVEELIESLLFASLVHAFQR